MKLLIDTHILLWWLGKTSELPRKARDLVSEPANTVFVSAATVWEIRIKERIGKLRLPRNFERVLGSQEFEQLPITIQHAHIAGKLPLHHRDPFDRMLVAQSICDGLTVLTHDRQISRYGVKLILA